MPGPGPGVVPKPGPGVSRHGGCHPPASSPGPEAAEAVPAFRGGVRVTTGPKLHAPPPGLTDSDWAGRGVKAVYISTIRKQQR